MSFIAKIITKKILKEKVANSFGQEDPYFESVPATRLDGKPTGKVKKRRKALPPGVSDHDGKVLTKVKRRAWRLDMCLFSICGIRFGWGSAIAIIPAIGDALDALMALMVFRTCCQVEDGLPAGIRLQMFFNILFDFVLGLVPFIGDLADAAFRCNTKNAVLLEQHLREKGKKNLLKAGKPVPDVDPSDPDLYERRRHDPDSDGEIIDQQPPRVETMHGSHPISRSNSYTHGVTNGSSPGRMASTRAPERAPTAPARAKTRGSQRSSGWFRRGRNRADDVEAGHSEVDEVPPSRHQSKRTRRER